MILLLALFYVVCLVAFAITILGGRQTAENGGFALLAQLVEHLCGKEAQTGTRVLIAAVRFLPTMLGRFPRRSQVVLTDYSPTSWAAVAQPRLQRRHVSPRRRGGRPSNEAAKGCKLSR